MASKNDDIEIKVKVDTSDVEKGMKDIEKASKTTSDRVVKNADKMEQAYEDVEKQLKDLQKQTQKAFNNMNISGFTNAMNKVKSQVQSTMKQVQSTISKALNVSANIKVKATTDTSTSQQNKQGSSGVDTGALLAGGAMGASLQSNLAKTKESAYDVIKAMGGITDSYRESIKEAMKFSRQSKALETAKTVYDEMAQSIQDAGYEIGDFGEAVEGAFLHLQDSMRNASTDSKRSMRDVSEALDNVIHLLSGNGLDNKLVRELMTTQQYLEKISKVSRGASNNDSPINENSVSKANRQLAVLQGNLDRIKPTINSIMNMSREDKAKKSLGDSVRKVKELGDAYLNAHPIVSKFYNTLNNNSTVKGMKAIGTSAKTHLGKAVEWFKKLRSEADNASKSVSKSSKNMQGGFKSLLSSIAPMLSIVGIFQTLKTSVTNAMESIETNNMFDTVFGDSANEMDAWIQKMNQTLGLGITDTKKFTATLSQMGSAMGLTGQEAMNMSQKMAQMAGDISSFYDADITQVQEDLRSALSGSYETMDKYGVVLRQSTVEQYAYANGIATVGAELTNAQRAMATTLYIEQALGQANGDLARSINSPANQLRILRANLYDLSVALGSCFMPILTVVLPILNRFVSALTSTINAVANFISQLFSLFGVSVGGGGGGSSSIGGGGGGGFLSDVADGVGSIGTALGDGLDSASGGAGAVADKLASGAESAKQMQKYLMGIDQINNIETDKDSGSSSPSGGGSGGSSSPSGGGGGGVGGGSIGGGLGDLFGNGDSGNSGSDGGEIPQWIEDIANALKAIWGQLKSGWLSVADYINQSIENLKLAFSNLGSSIKDFLIGAWNNGGDELIYNFGRLAGAITGAVIDIFGQVVQAVANLFAYLNPDNNPYTRAFITGLNTLLVACQNFALSVGGWFRTFLDNGGQAFLNVMGDICMIIGTILTQILADAINTVTNFMNSWAGYVIISAVALSLNVIAGVIKAVLLAIQKLLPYITKLGVVFAGLMLLKIANDFTNTWVAINSGLVPLSSMTTLGGKLANKLGLLLANVKLTRASIVAFTKDLAKFALQGLKQALKFCGDLAKGVLQLIGHMAKLIAQFAISTATKIINFFKHPIATIKSLGTAILTCAQNVVKFGASLLTNAVKGLVGLASQCVAGIASLLGLSVAEGTATAGAIALQLALDALGIGLIILAIVGLVQAFKNWDKITAKVKELWEKFLSFLQEKCPWLYNIFKAIGDAIKWIADGIGKAWNKVKSFFGWEGDNKIEEEVNATDDSLGGLGDTIEETSERFGTATSAINTALSSIGIDSNKLASQLDEAEAMFNEKFNMISGNAREYLQAIADGNEEALTEMSGDADKYTKEIKSAFEDMSIQEQAVFYATYGEINGITDGWLDYTKGSYEDCLFKHTAMLEQIANDENLTYDEKLKRIEEEKKAFVEAQNEKVRQLNLTIAEMESAEWQSEEDKYRALQPYYEQRNKLVADLEEYQLGSIDSVDEAVKQSAQAQEDAYDGVSNSQTEALEEVDTALEETKDNLSSFSEESEDTSKEIKKHWDGIGDDISDEFEDALKGVGDNFKGILNNTKKQCQQLKSGLQATFNDMKSGVKKSMVEINSTITTKFTQAVNQVKTVANGFKTSLQTIFKSISSGLTTSINSIKTTMTNGFNSMSTSITSTMNSCKNTITNTLNSINTQVKSKTTAIKNTVSTTFNSLAKTFTSPFSSASTTISSSLATMNSTIATRLRTIVSTLQSYATKMKNTMNFNFPTPYLRMPHISVYGNWDFEKKTVPSFRVNILHPYVETHIENRPKSVELLIS